jgi:ketosteroid isomerase-like protein
MGSRAPCARGHPLRGGRVSAAEDAGVVRRLYDARAANDLDSAQALIATDVIWHEPYDYLGTLNGRDAVMSAIRQSMAETGGTFQLTVTDLLASEEHVVALVDFSAERHGQRLSGREVGVFRVDRGLIREVWFYTAEDPDVVSEFMRGEPAF